MNSKLARQLRRASGYTGEEIGPKLMPFPGVARLVTMPVYRTRVTVKTCYVRLPLADKPEKVQTPTRRMVVDNRGQAILEFEVLKAGTVPTEFAEDGKTPTAFNKHDIVRPKTSLVPVSKAARLDAKSPKGIYRHLKRLARRGMTVELDIALQQARKEGATV
jgi:hypothetical protein